MDPVTAPGPAPDSRNAAQRQLGRIAAARRVLATKSLAALAVLIVLIVFVIENSQPVKVHLFFASGHPRLIWVIVFCSALGGLIGYLIGRPSSARR